MLISFTVEPLDGGDSVVKWSLSQRLLRHRIRWPALVPHGVHVRKAPGTEVLVPIKVVVERELRGLSRLLGLWLLHGPARIRTREEHLRVLCPLS